MQNKLPKDWEIKTLGDILKISSGNGLTKSKRNDEGEYLVYGGNGITGKHNEYLFEEEKLIIGRVGAHCGNAYITKPKSWVTDNAFVVSFNDTELNKKFLLNLIGVLNLNKYSVSTAQPVISQRTIYPIEIILPPLETQQAIVSKIEELFSELDKGIEDLKTAQQQLKTYRQSVLKWAFEGKLTNKKVKDGVLPKGWEWKKISDISKVVRGGSPRPAGDPKYYDGNIPFLKVADLTKDNGIYLTTFKYTIKEAGLHKTRQITPNTLLLTNSGATLGVPKICMINATMNDGVAAFLDLDERSNHYLYYFWVSKTLELRGINMGAGQPNLNTDLIKDYDLPYCSFEEQHKIVQEIESRLSVADKMEESIAQSLLQAEALRQSILKKAFSGELI